MSFIGLPCVLLMISLGYYLTCILFFTAAMLAKYLLIYKLTTSPSSTSMKAVSSNCAIEFFSDCFTVPFYMSTLVTMTALTVLSLHEGKEYFRQQIFIYVFL